MENISITIPTLNEEGNIENCIRLLNEQIKRGDEIIVVDGGSSDSTQSICRNLGAKVIVEEGSSIGEARHIGAMQAENDVIATTDADALPPQGWLDRIRGHFENKDIAVLWGNIQDKNGVPIRNLIGKFSTLVGGASGNNTAYSMEYYNKLDDVYPDISFSEDFIAIARLASVGPAVRDENLVMVMDMDRSRYQTKPMIAMGAGLLIGGTILDGDIGRTLQGTGIGLGATEFTYENATGTPFHHDQVGVLLVAYGHSNEHDIVTGAGIGLVLHHMMTEGISALPTILEKGTDMVIKSRKPGVTQ